jgi:paraquat-inducible protein B
MMKTKTRYFKIGIFLLSGVCVLVVAIVLFGAGRLFKKEIIVETYFADSVQGLDVGSPVKYRGVKIGEVKDIGIVYYHYDLDGLSQDEIYTYGLYVRVTVSLPASILDILGEGDHKAELATLIEEKGLRLKLDYIGITGLSYLDLDFMEVDKHPLLDIRWEPKQYYIPSVRNTIQVITESLNDIAQSMQSDFIPLLENLNTASREIPEMTTVLKETLQSLGDTFEKVSTMADDFPGLAKKLDETLFHLNQVFKNDVYDVEEIIHNVRELTSDLKITAENLKHYPSHVFFGEAPPRIE